MDPRDIAALIEKNLAGARAQVEVPHGWDLAMALHTLLHKDRRDVVFERDLSVRLCKKRQAGHEKRFAKK